MSDQQVMVLTLFDHKAWPYFPNGKSIVLLGVSQRDISDISKFRNNSQNKHAKAINIFLKLT